MTALLRSTRLWRMAFGSDDAHARLLEQSLLQARESVGELLTGIPGDMKGYTVHDLSHLDALWEMADLISGEAFSLNPAEAYVFGLSVLMHDAGMTIMAYPGGLAELAATPTWAEELVYRNIPVGREISEIPAQSRSALITNVLRRLHAERAEKLATQAWTLRGAQYRLIQNDDLRDHYGVLAGRIAHSHHWDASSLSIRFPNALGAMGQMPAEWIVEPIKVAALLRCADAAHIDHRRAPRLTFAMVKPEGVSEAHWSFQSRLAKPYVKDGRLCYTSRDAFATDDIDAWYLCYDTARMVDKELGDAVDLLRAAGARFAVDGVNGAKSVSSFADYVAVTGWRPVAVDVQVSDVPSLAKNLGGHALYTEFVAPLRELIQNAADSIDARCAVDPSFSRDAGVITVRLRPVGDRWHLDVEDNGIGMSERVLTRALLDFGKSFWRSEFIHEEYPEFQNGFAAARGRYGIGFFSVFMWSDQVMVSSRRFGDAIADTNVLEFTGGIGKRPILRRAESRERSSSISTRVTLTVADSVAKQLMKDGEKQRGDYETYRSYGVFSSDIPASFKPVELVVAALDIAVFFDDPSGIRCVNNKNWADLSGDEFIRYFGKYCGEVESSALVGSQLSEVISDGVVIGKAMLVPSYLAAKAPMVLVHEQGITVERRALGRKFGVVRGRAQNAARDRSGTNALFDGDAWISDQRKKVFASALDTSRQIAAQQVLVGHDTFSRDHDMFIVDRKICSFNQVLDAVSKAGRAVLRFEQDYDEDIKWAEIDSLSVLIGLNVDPAEIFTLCEIEVGSGDQDLVGEVATGSTEAGLVSELIAEVRRVLAPAIVTVASNNRDTYTRRTDYRVTVVRKSDAENS